MTFDWGRDLDTALENSANAGKPVLVLFQEIPGIVTEQATQAVGQQHTDC